MNSSLPCAIWESWTGSTTLAEHPDHAELTLKNIIDIAHSMKKQCIAVGIDREETYQKAVKLGGGCPGGPLCGGKS